MTYTFEHKEDKNKDTINVHAVNKEAALRKLSDLVSHPQEWALIVVDAGDGK